MDNAHDPEKLGLPKAIKITFLDGETLEGQLEAVTPKRMVVKTADGKELSVYKHAVKFFEA
jgi:sRNA-binding regulator protein Hfq